MKQHHIVNVLSKQIRIAFGIQSASFLSKINGVIQCETCKTAREYKHCFGGGHVCCSINSYQSPRVNTGILSAHGIFHTRVRVRVNYRLPVPRYPGILTSLISTRYPLPATRYPRFPQCQYLPATRVFHHAVRSWHGGKRG